MSAARSSADAAAYARFATPASVALDETRGEALHEMLAQTRAYLERHASEIRAIAHVLRRHESNEQSAGSPHSASVSKVAHTPRAERAIVAGGPTPSVYQRGELNSTWPVKTLPFPAGGAGGLDAQLPRPINVGGKVQGPRGARDKMKRLSGTFMPGHW